METVAVQRSLSRAFQRRAKVRLELSTSEMKKVVAQKQLINDYENRVQVAAQTGELDENDEGWGLPTQEVM